MRLKGRSTSTDQITFIRITTGGLKMSCSHVWESTGADGCAPVMTYNILVTEPLYRPQQSLVKMCAVRANFKSNLALHWNSTLEFANRSMGSSLVDNLGKDDDVKRRYAFSSQRRPVESITTPLQLSRLDCPTLLSATGAA